jgi:sarcosine oxidase subunit gamma
LAYHVLADSASAPYLWDCLIDAMAEFGGGPVGVDELLDFASS